MKTAIELLNKHSYEPKWQAESVVLEKALIAMEEYASQFKPKWISVSDKLPEDMDNCLICSVHGELVRTVTSVFKNGKFLAYNYFTEELEVAEEFTHWMPLPENPEI